MCNKFAFNEQNGCCYNWRGGTCENCQMKEVLINETLLEVEVGDLGGKGEELSDDD